VKNMDFLKNIFGGSGGGGMVDQEATALIDGAIDKAIDLIVAKVPAASGAADASKQRIKAVANEEITKLMPKAS
jgi:hypothetical protein